MFPWDTFSQQWFSNHTGCPYRRGKRGMFKLKNKKEKSGCLNCSHFNNDPVSLESIFTNLRIMGSAYSSVCGDSGICDCDDCFRLPRTACDNYMPRWFKVWSIFKLRHFDFIVFWMTQQGIRIMNKWFCSSLFYTLFRIYILNQNDMSEVSDRYLFWLPHTNRTSIRWNNAL